MEKPISIRITPGSMIVSVMILVGFWFFYEIREFIPLILSALVFSAALEPGKNFLVKYKIPNSIAVVILYVFVFAIAFFLISAFVPIIVEQYGIFVESLPRLVDTFYAKIEGTFLSDVFKTPTDSESSIFGTEKLSGILNSASESFFSIFNGIISLILFLVLTFLFTVRSDGVNTVLSVMSPYPYRGYVLDLWTRARYKLGQWFQGQIILMFIIGALTYAALSVAGIPNALLLAVFAGLLEIIPIFGPIIAAIPAVLMASVSGNLTTVLIVVGIFFVIQQFENNLIHPLVVTKVVGVPSVLVILSIVIGGSLIGFIGVLIAVPIVAVLQEFFKDLREKNIEAFARREIKEMEKTKA